MSHLNFRHHHSLSVRNNLPSWQVPWKVRSVYWRPPWPGRPGAPSPSGPPSPWSWSAPSAPSLGAPSPSCLSPPGLASLAPPSPCRVCHAHVAPALVFPCKYQNWISTLSYSYINSINCYAIESLSMFYSYFSGCNILIASSSTFMMCVTVCAPCGLCLVTSNLMLTGRLSRYDWCGPSPALPPSLVSGEHSALVASDTRTW